MLALPLLPLGPDQFASDWSVHPGVIAIASGALPTPMAASDVEVAVSIGVTVLDPELAT